MDWRESLELLKRWPADENLPLSPEQEEALRQLEHDPELDRAFRQQDALDDRISWAMSDVPVPEDLPQRLLSSLETPELPVAVPAPSLAPHPARRRALATFVAASLLAGAALWTWIWSAQGQPFDAEQFKLAVRTAWDRQDELPAFDGSFEADLPQGGWRSNRVEFAEGSLGYSSAHDGAHRVAVRRFSVWGQTHQRHDGLLLIVPVSDVADEALPPPQGNYLSSGRAHYVDLPDGTSLAVVSWQESNRVYLCILPRGRSEEALRSALQLGVS